MPTSPPGAAACPDDAVHGLRVAGVTVRRGRQDVLHRLSFQAGPGIHAVLGPNGAGKSTLFGALVGRVPVADGEVRWGDAELHRPPPRPGMIGWLPQELRFPATMRIRDVLRYAAWATQVDRGPEAERAVEQALGLGDLASLADRRVGQLSGGERRRVGLAAAMVADPELVLLDEPTTGLDPIQRQGLHERIRALSPDRVVLLATHLLEDVATTAEHVILLHEGTVRFTGTITEFVDDAAPTLEKLRSAMLRRLGRTP